MQRSISVEVADSIDVCLPPNQQLAAVVMAVGSCSSSSQTN